MVGLDVFDSRELQATLVAMKVLPAEVRKQTRKFTKALVDGEWQKGLQQRAVTPLQTRTLVTTATSAVSDRNVALKSATKGRVGRGIPSSVLAKGAEFGADINAYSRYQRRSPKGKVHTVTRRTTKQFGHFRRDGRVVYPTAHDILPRVASLYVQTLLRTAAEAFEN